MARFTLQLAVSMAVSQLQRSTAVYTVVPQLLAEAQFRTHSSARRILDSYCVPILKCDSNMARCTRVSPQCVRKRSGAEVAGLMAPTDCGAVGRRGCVY